MDYFQRQGLTMNELAENALASFGFVRPRNGFVFGFGAARVGDFTRIHEQRSVMQWRATDGAVKFVDRGGEFGRVRVAFLPLILNVSSCL